MAHKEILALVTGDGREARVRDSGKLKRVAYIDAPDVYCQVILSAHDLNPVCGIHPVAPDGLVTADTELFRHFLQQERGKSGFKHIFDKHFSCLADGCSTKPWGLRGMEATVEIVLAAE